MNIRPIGQVERWGEIDPSALDGIELEQLSTPHIMCGIKIALYVDVLTRNIYQCQSNNHGTVVWQQFTFNEDAEAKTAKGRARAAYNRIMHFIKTKE